MDLNDSQDPSPPGERALAVLGAKTGKTYDLRPRPGDVDVPSPGGSDVEGTPTEHEEEHKIWRRGAPVDPRASPRSGPRALPPRPCPRVTLAPRGMASGTTSRPGPRTTFTRRPPPRRARCALSTSTTPPPPPDSQVGSDSLRVAAPLPSGWMTRWIAASV